VAAHDKVVIALYQAEIVRPQNYCARDTWHTDSGRALLNRVTGGDWPETFALCRTILHSAYSGRLVRKS
jgi:hypothetical protein